MQHIINTQLQGTGVEDTLAYYRAAVQTKYRDPDLSPIFDRLNNPISTPTKVLCGTIDMRKEMLPRQTDLFTDTAQYQFELIEGAGHFLHREKPEQVNDAILDWFGE